MKKVIVVDDEELVGRSFAALLEVFGYDTTWYSSAPEFLADEGYRDADCLIVDYRLSDGQFGSDLLLQLGDMKVEVPAILLSGNIDEVTEIGDENYPASIEMLGKPCSVTTLRNTINHLLAT